MDYQSTPSPSSLPKVIKYILAILGIIALVMVIFSNIYYEVLSTYRKINQSKVYAPTITVPEKFCDFSSGSAKYFSATIKTSDVEKTRQSILDLAGKYKAVIINSSNVLGESGSVLNFLNNLQLQPVHPPFIPVPPSYVSGRGTISMSVSSDQADAFIKEVKNIAGLPNELSNEDTRIDTYDILKQRCQEIVNNLTELQSAEKIYLEQISNNKVDTQSFISNLVQIRRDAKVQSDNIKNLVDNVINKLTATVTIIEVPGG